MITFKRVEVKRETRTLKHYGFSWEYKLYYVARYDGERLTGISKHETKYFDTSNGMTGGNYMSTMIQVVLFGSTLRMGHRNTHRPTCQKIGKN